MEADGMLYSAQLVGGKPIAPWPREVASVGPTPRRVGNRGPVEITSSPARCSVATPHRRGQLPAPTNAIWPRQRC